MPGEQRAQRFDRWLAAEKAKLQALNRLERAVNVEGPAPLYHDREIERLRVNWPELSFAVAELLKAHGRRYPPSWEPTELRWSAARYLLDWLRRDSKEKR